MASVGDVEGASRFHMGAWLLWLAAGMLGALLTRNLFYLALLSGVALFVNARLSRRNWESNAARGGRLLLVTVVMVTVVVAVFKGLWSNPGLTVLWRLPDWWPDLGRVVTLEGLLSAGLDALQILSILAVFVAFGAGADYYALLRSTPTFMHQVGLVTSIAITFVPQTVTRFTEVREAQALRGHRVRRIGDLIPLVVPLLSGGMERSIDLAEAMESRGFSRAPGEEHRLRPVLVQAGLALGLGLVLVGGALFAFLPPEAQWAGWLTLLSGVALIAATLWSVGKGIRRTRYRRSVWTSRDTALAMASLGSLAILLSYFFASPGALAYTPYPRALLPPFDPAVAVAMLALAAPIPVALLWGDADNGGKRKTDAANHLD